MFIFTVAGEVTPPMGIFPNERLTKALLDSIPGLSDNGWMNSDIFFEYIENMFGHI